PVFDEGDRDLFALPGRRLHQAARPVREVVMSEASTALQAQAAPVSADRADTGRRKQVLVLIAVSAAIALLPFLVTDVYLQNIMVLTLMYAALAQSWNILGGYCGQISLGHALYFGVGAYATSFLFVTYGVLPWFGLVAGGALSAVLALVLGYFCFR